MPTGEQARFNNRRYSYFVGADNVHRPGKHHNPNDKPVAEIKEEPINVCQVWLLSQDKPEFKEMIWLCVAERLFNELTHHMDTQDHSFVLNRELKQFGKLYEEKHEWVTNATVNDADIMIQSIFRLKGDWLKICPFLMFLLIFFTPPKLVPNIGNIWTGDSINKNTDQVQLERTSKWLEQASGSYYPIFVVDKEDSPKNRIVFKTFSFKTPITEHFQSKYFTKIRYLTIISCLHRWNDGATTSMMVARILGLLTRNKSFRSEFFSQSLAITENQSQISSAIENYCNAKQIVAIDLEAMARDRNVGDGLDNAYGTDYILRRLPSLKSTRERTEAITGEGNGQESVKRKQRGCCGFYLLE